MSETLYIAKELSSEHLRMARAGLNLTVRELAMLSEVNKATIVRMEAGHTIRKSTMIAVREALEELGAQFLVSEKANEVLVSISQSVPDSMKVYEVSGES